MDAALELRKLVDSGKALAQPEILDYLAASELLVSLKEPCDTLLAHIWRLIALSEIPGTQLLEETRQVATFVIDKTFCGVGFSLTGKETDILPCYLAMITKALLRLQGITEETEAGVRWILENQPFSRTKTSPWKGRGTSKYGGCLKSTPCYIGVVKSLATLLEYCKIKPEASQLREKIHEGRDYVLSHDLVFRRTTGVPITDRILDISFPESYQLNIVDVIQTLDSNSAERLTQSKALDYLLSRSDGAGTWRISHEYKAKGYRTFDRRGHGGDWVSYIIGNKLREFHR